MLTMPYEMSLNYDLVYCHHSGFEVGQFLVKQVYSAQGEIPLVIPGWRKERRKGLLQQSYSFSDLLTGLR